MLTREFFVNLGMSIAGKYRPRYKYDDYLLWEGRWELIEGMPYAMSPAPDPGHQRVSLNLAAVFREVIKASCVGCQVYLPIDWKLSEETVVQPDLLVASRPVEKQYLDFTPALVVEIVSPSSVNKDKHEKYELYGQEGVRYYLLADPQTRKLEIYEHIDKKYQPVALSHDQYRFALDGGCSLPVNFSGIWD